MTSTKLKVFEDDPVIRRMISDMLQKMGIRSLQKPATFERRWALAQSAEFDLTVLDEHRRSDELSGGIACPAASP